MTEKELLKVEADKERAFKMGFAKGWFMLGKSVSEIAAKLEVSPSTVRSWKKKLSA